MNIKYFMYKNLISWLILCFTAAVVVFFVPSVVTAYCDVFLFLCQLTVSACLVVPYWCFSFEHRVDYSLRYQPINWRL
jgi:hypothetical protein